MVALRGSNNSGNSLSHACIGRGHSQGGADVPVSYGHSPMGLPPQAVVQHLAQGGINLQPLNNISLQYLPAQSNALKHEHASRYTNNCILPSHHYRLLPQTRTECYHTPSGVGPAYMSPGNPGGSPVTGQPGMRVPPAQQPTAPPQQQQERQNASMSAHNYGPPQNQTAQARQQYQSYSFRPTQHGTRPSTHPRQQQPYIPSPAASTTGQLLYSMPFPPAHMGIPQTYQQQRTQGFYPYVPSFINYTTHPTSPYYYPSGTQQMPTSNLGASGQGARGGANSLVSSQAVPAAPNGAANAMQHQAPQPHMHQNMSGLPQNSGKRISHRVPIINPVTKQDIFQEFNSNDSQYMSGESSERQTPQPDTFSSVREEFTRMVNEVANQPTVSENTMKSSFIPKNMDLPIEPTPPVSAMQPPVTMSSPNNNVAKQDALTVDESKGLVVDVPAEPVDTPVVSAISDSPVIVPKVIPTVKQIQKNCEQPLVLDTSKSPPPKNQTNKNKPVVPSDVEVLESRPDETPSAAEVPVVAVVDVESDPAPVAAMPAPDPVPTLDPLPQPQRVREPRERVKSEETPKPNGPTPSVEISSVDSFQEFINLPTSQTCFVQKATSHEVSGPKVEIEHDNTESVTLPTVAEIEPILPNIPTATELLSASIEVVVTEDSPLECISEVEVLDLPVSDHAEAKLSPSPTSCNSNNQTTMKDINLNNQTTDPDTANGNTATETVSINADTEDINKNTNLASDSKNLDETVSNMANCDQPSNETDSYENGKNETDKLSNVEQENVVATEEPILAPQEKPVFVPKYKYSEDQWSPINTSGKKLYDINFLKQIKDDPMSKNKPEGVPMLDKVLRAMPLQDTSLPFASIMRPINDSVLPTFMKSQVGNRNTLRDPKKDGRTAMPSGKGSVKMMAAPNISSNHKPVIHVSLSLREDVKLNESENAWKPSRFQTQKRETVDEHNQQTEEVYKKFRGILNKLTPQKFDTLLNSVKGLEINTQTRLEGVIDLVFEKAIDEPNFSEAYAAMCNKLSTLKVPADNPSNPGQVVNFRNLIISRCQNQFVTAKTDEHVTKLEKDLAESTDPTKRKELQAQLVEENRKVRMRSVGNVRFIGELYKLKMLTVKIMVYCMNHLIDKIEEEKLECLCKLLTTIGEQVESEVKDQLESIFKKMQEIVDKKSHKISSRVRFMIQDVIELRKRRWFAKSVVDSQPKMMDQIQKEAEQHQRQIEFMNSSPMGGSFRRDDGGRGKRGDSRRQGGPNSYMDNNWQNTRIKYSVDTSKLKAATNKSLLNIKLAPHQSAWNQGSGAKTTTGQQASNSLMSLPTTTNMYSVLENVQTDPSTLRGTKDQSPVYHSKGASIERSTFNSRAEFGSGGRTGSMGVPLSNSGNRGPAESPRDSRSGSPAPAPAPAHAPAPAPAPVPVQATAPPVATTPPVTPVTPTPMAIVEQEPIPAKSIQTVKSIIEQWLVIHDDKELVDEINHRFTAHHHAAFITELLNIAVEKPTKVASEISKVLLHLVSTNVISAGNFVTGLNEVLEFGPDLYIDIPMLYENLGAILSPQIEKKHISLNVLLKMSENIIAANHGHLFLKSLIKELKLSMGPSFVTTKWQESGIELKQWMNEDQVAKFVEDNKFEFLEGGAASNETGKILTPTETQSKLLQLMNSEESFECIRGWVQDNLGKASDEDWFMRSLMQAVCEHALFGAVGGREAPHFNKDRMSKYTSLINEFGESKQDRETNCLVGIQQLVHRLEHPQGLTLELFQYLHDQYVISVDGFLSWQRSETEPEGKGVMMKALTSFFTSIQEADNEDSCSED